MHKFVDSPSELGQSAPVDTPIELVKITAVRGPFGGGRISAELPTGGSIADLMRALGIEPEVAARVFLADRLVEVLGIASIFFRGLARRLRSEPFPPAVVTARTRNFLLSSLSQLLLLLATGQEGSQRRLSRLREPLRPPGLAPQAHLRVLSRADGDLGCYGFWR